MVKTGSVTTMARPKSPSFSLLMPAATCSIWGGARNVTDTDTFIQLFVTITRFVSAVFIYSTSDLLETIAGLSAPLIPHESQ